MLGEIDRNRKPIQPQYFLAKPNREIIRKLSEIFNDSVDVKLNDVSELSFSLPYFIDKYHKLNPNKNVELIKERYLIKVVTGIKVEWFIVNDISDNLDDSDIMQVKCYSLVRELSDKLIKSYEVESYGADKVIEDMLRMGNTIWNIDYIDADFKSSKRAFEFPSSTVLEAIYSIAEVYNAIVTFDTDTRTLSMTKPELTGINMGLTVSYGKLMKSMSRNRSSEEMVTRLSASGKDGLGINKVNPTGQNYIENYGYWIYPFKRDANKTVISPSFYMSDSLCHALLDYEALVESKTGLFKQYLEELEGYETQLNQLKVDLNKLQQDEKVVQEVTLAQQFGDKMFFEKYSHSGSTSRTFKLNKGYNYAAMIKVDSSSGLTVALNGSVKSVTSSRWVMLGKLNNLDTATITVNGSSTGVFMQVATISIEEYQMAGNDNAIVERYSLDNKENQINLKQIEISNKLNQITNVQNRTKALQVLLDSENNFTSEQLQELNYYVIEREFNDDVYIDEQDLYDAAMEKFKELQVPQLAVEIDIVNFLEIIEEQRNWKKLNLGDFVNVKYEPLGIELTARISEINYDFGGSSIKLTLSNAKNVNDESKRLEKYLKDTKNTNVVVSNGRPDWTKAVVDSSEMSRLFDNFWNKITNEINMASNEFVTLDRTGLTIIDPDDPLRFLRATHGVIALTRSGGLKYESALTADGLIAEQVLGKIILGQRVVIGDTTGVFTIEGSKLMIDDRCGRPVLRLGLTSEQPDVFGLHVNRYASSNCNDRTITNISGINNSRGFYIDKIRNGVTSNVFWLAQDGNLRLRVGENNEVITVSELGFGIGHENWNQAPFRVDYFGNCWLDSLFANNAEIKNSLFKDGHIRGSDLELRDTKGGVIKMYPEWGLWFGSEDFDEAPASISMDGTAKFKKLIVTDGNNTLLMDSEKKQLHLNRWDIVGAGAIDTELLAANILTAEDGFISSLVAGKLSTLTNAALQGWSNYVKIEGKEIKFLTGKVKGSGVHKELSDGRKLYWISSEQKGEMTVEVTPWPVYVYEMEDKTKMRLFFEGDGEQAYPIIDMGEGDSRGYGRGSIQKPNGSFDFVYLNSNYGREKSLRLTDDGVTLLSELGPINIKGKEINLITESGSAIKMTSDGDIEIKASKNVKINGTRIDLN
ncbi:phage tail spike protein [Paenibacillus sp. NPDC057886]|uniref:phage tail spike protein n=1 Tax=Paenibacillus sp. NPDC057886 TaxID=3346270 RepID=UPI0036B938C9